MGMTIKQMLEAGMHLGHQTNKWNPKMKPFIYTEQNNLHILDLLKTQQYAKRAFRVLRNYTSQGKKVIFVGTKKEAKSLIAEYALECNSFYINEKWVGGILTNWKTFKRLTAKLILLEKQESNGFLQKLPKKEMAKKLKEKEKLTKLFNGIKSMKQIPDVAIIVGQLEEMNTLRECSRLGICTITLVDSNCNPSLADFSIPANDDSVPSIQLFLEECSLAIQQGASLFREKNAKKGGSMGQRSGGRERTPYQNRKGGRGPNHLKKSYPVNDIEKDALQRPDRNVGLPNDR